MATTQQEFQATLIEKKPINRGALMYKNPKNVQVLGFLNFQHLWHLQKSINLLITIKAYYL